MLIIQLVCRPVVLIISIHNYVFILAAGAVVVLWCCVFLQVLLMVLHLVSIQRL